MISLELILALASAVGAMATAAGVLLLTARLREDSRRKYDFEKHRAVLDPSREFVESKIEDLYLQLYRDPKKWAEVNHVLVDAARAKGADGSEKAGDPIQFMRSSRFLAEMGIAADDIVIDERSVFVLTPFHQSQNKVYSVISNVCSDLGLLSTRGDEQFVEGPLLSHIVRLMVRANFLIANVNGRNPNVFYELGIAHTLGKRVIIVSKNYDSIPFDLKQQQVLLYEDLDELRISLKDSVARLAVRAVTDR